MTHLAFDPSRREVQMDPFPFYRRLRDESPVCWIDALCAYGLFRYADCKNAFLHPETYSAKDFIKQAFGDLDPVPEVPSIIAMDPPEHTPLRKLAGQAFTPTVMRCSCPTMSPMKTAGSRSSMKPSMSMARSIFWSTMRALAVCRRSMKPDPINGTG